MKSGIMLSAAGVTLMCCMDAGAILIVGACLINFRRSAAATPATT